MKNDVFTKSAFSLCQLKRRKCTEVEKEILKVKYKINSFTIGHVIELLLCDMSVVVVF
jgi:hypothetical protein